MTDSGAVDPIRVPEWLREPVERAWRETPPVARLFVGLAFVDVLSRGAGILQPRVDVGLDPLAIYFMLVPQSLWILLPAVLVLRRPDAARVTPLVFAGAVVAAVAALVWRPLESWFSGPFGLTPMSVEIGILHQVADTAAWILIARGLVALNPMRPSATAAGASNLVVAIGALGLIVELGREVLAAVNTGDPSFNGLLALSSVMSAVALAAWLYLLWIVIRGYGDTRRPPIGTVTGAVGAGLTGLLAPLGTILAAALVASPPQIGADGSFAAQGLLYAIGVLDLGLGQALVIVAFALGLAEPPLPYVPALPAAVPPALHAAPMPEAASPVPDAGPPAEAAAAVPPVAVVQPSAEDESAPAEA